MRLKMHFALKGTFPIETIVKKNSKNPKKSKMLLNYFLAKKIEK